MLLQAYCRQKSADGATEDEDGATEDEHEASDDDSSEVLLQVGNTARSALEQEERMENAEAVAFLAGELLSDDEQQPSGAGRALLDRGSSHQGAAVVHRSSLAGFGGIVGHRAKKHLHLEADRIQESMRVRAQPCRRVPTLQHSELRCGRASRSGAN